jgi:hypothetical protein
MAARGSRRGGISGSAVAGEAGRGDRGGTGAWGSACRSGMMWGGSELISCHRRSAPRVCLRPFFRFCSCLRDSDICAFVPGECTNLSPEVRVGPGRKNIDFGWKNFFLIMYEFVCLCGSLVGIFGLDFFFFSFLLIDLKQYLK